MTTTTFPARYAGTCAVCREPIAKGAPIARMNREYRHGACDPNSIDALAATVRRLLDERDLRFYDEGNIAKTLSGLTAGEQVRMHDEKNAPLDETGAAALRVACGFRLDASVAAGDGRDLTHFAHVLRFCPLKRA